MKHLWIIELEVQNVSAKGKNIIQKLIKGEEVSPERFWSFKKRME